MTADDDLKLFWSLPVWEPFKAETAMDDEGLARLAPHGATRIGETVNVRQIPRYGASNGTTVLAARDANGDLWRTVGNGYRERFNGF